jgi:hypothetical protein
MITIPQKMILSFLFSVFLFTGIAALVFFGIFDLGVAASVFPQQVQVIIIPAFFLILFFIIFFYLHLRQDFAKNDDIPSARPRLAGSGSFELIGKGEVVELEDISTKSGGNISILGRFFFFHPANPESLQEAGNEVIYEHNGIHYINDDAFNSDKNMEREINNDFAQLVASVVNKA